MNTITLPSGNTVTLKEVSMLKHRDRARVSQAIKIKDGLTSLDEGFTIQDAILSCLIVSWSFELMVPSVKIDSLGELSIEDYDTLSAEADKAGPVLFPDLFKTFEAEQDPKVDTEVSSD
jgi:hypothetical protein